MKRLIVLILAGFILGHSGFLQAQNTFQKIYEFNGSAQIYGQLPTSDGGLAVAGVVDDGTALYSFMAKMNCKGEVKWARRFQNTFTWNNVSHQLVETGDGHYLLATTTGTFQAYNIMVAKVSTEGEVIWQKVMNGARDDIAADIALASDGSFIVVGGTNSYGEDVNSGSLTYKDVYALKFNAEGNLEWSRTFGNEATVDNANAVIATSDGGFAITGRYIEKGAFHALLLKLDGEGNLEFMRTYGDTLHRNYAFDLIETNGGGFALTGSTTLNKENFQSYPDVFLIRTDAQGDTLWTRAYTGTANDRSDIGSSLLQTPDGGFAIAMATLSYPGTGFVPNKHVILKTDSEGQLEFSRSYSGGSSHYPELRAMQTGEGYVLSGFSTTETTSFSPVVYFLNENLEGSCEIEERTGLTLQMQPPFVVTTPATVQGEGANFGASQFRDTLSFNILTLCENIMVDSCDALAVSDQTPIASLPGKLRLFPNPAAGQTELLWEANPSGSFSFQLFDALGRLRWYKLQELPAGDLRMSIPLHHLEPGLYRLRIGQGERTAILNLSVTE